MQHFDHFSNPWPDIMSESSLWGISTCVWTHCETLIVPLNFKTLPLNLVQHVFGLTPSQCHTQDIVITPGFALQSFQRCLALDKHMHSV